jgi:predicted RNA-binding protein YlqC (UPF0109 family)
MQELVEYIAGTIATHPDDVKVTEEIQEDGHILVSLEVHPDDKGKVIGRQGRMAQAMRVLLRVAATKQDARITLEIV